MYDSNSSTVVIVDADLSPAEAKFKKAQDGAERAARDIGQRIIDIWEKALGGIGRVMSGISAGIIAIAASFSRSFIAATQAVASFVAAHVAAAAAIGRNTAAIREQAGAAELLVDAFRAVRLALNPSIFTATTIAVGVLIEKMVQLANARAKLIQRQALSAAASDLKINGSSVDAAGAYHQFQIIDATARLSGGDAGTIRDIQAALSSQFEKNPSDTKKAFGALGIGGYYSGFPSAEALQKIAQAFASIEDPIKRAEAAVQLFGSDKAAEALQQLNSRFAEGSKHVEDFGLTLDETSTKQIYNFRRHLLEIKDFFTDFSWLQAFGAKIEQVLEVATGKADDFVSHALARIDGWVYANVPGVSAATQYFRGPNDDELRTAADRDLKYGNGAIKGYLAVRDKTLADAQAAASADLVRQAYEADSRRLSSFEGQQEELGRARSRRDQALRALRDDDARDTDNKAKLTTAQRQQYATQYLTSSQLVQLLQERTGETQRSRDDLARAAEDLLGSRKQSFQA
ncbi:MAG TPA: hypothetical protein VHB50_14285, partial [Bryobacteraceae bacterium]|nr:hypothetical protein [Bryobacteraceae bacterium]